MDYNIWWNTTLIDGCNEVCKPLIGECTTQYLVVGGGVAGLHAAKYLSDQGFDVVLIEKGICGSGMSGRSGGFLTPDSELGLRQIESTYGFDIAQKLWSYSESGQQSIVEMIKTYNLDCELKDDDNLFLGIAGSGEKYVQAEHAIRLNYGLSSQLLSDIQGFYHEGYYANAVRYGNTYSINPLQYCQTLKHQLIKQGVTIFENSEIKKIDKQCVYTNLGSVAFEKAIFCLGKVSLDLDAQKAKNTYGNLTYVAVSEPLSDDQIKQIMPFGHCLCQDTQMIFTYYRLTEDRRLLVGGGNAFTTFQPFSFRSPLPIKRVIAEMRKIFPSLQQVSFHNYRSGRIESTQDLMPMIGQDAIFSHHLWVQGCVGLPWAAASGKYVAQKLLGIAGDADLDRVFDPHRSFTIPIATNSLRLKPFIFGLGNAKAMFG